MDDLSFLEDLAKEYAESSTTGTVEEVLYLEEESPSETIIRLMHENSTVFEDYKYDFNEELIKEINSARNSNFFSPELFNTIANSNFLGMLDVAFSNKIGLTNNFQKSFIFGFSATPALLDQDSYF